MQAVTGEEGDDMGTMKEVAKQSGVSVATVSRYINKSGYVSEDTGINIQKAIDALDYTPNEVARSLYQKIKTYRHPFT